MASRSWGSTRRCLYLGTTISRGCWPRSRTCKRPWPARSRPSTCDDSARDDSRATATQAMTGQGGWPLTVFMTPDKKPFFVGTYFPKQSMQGRMGLLDLLPRIQQAWQNNRHDILESGEDIVKMLQQPPGDYGEAVLS